MSQSTGRYDAYLHVGLPRFGSFEDAVATCDRWGTEKGVLVLGPAVPDAGSLLRGLTEHGDRFRGVGIPFGETADQRFEFTECVLDAGLIGIRFQGTEALDNPRILEGLGERGGWAFAVGAVRTDDMAKALLAWLEKHEGARVAAPHFLTASGDQVKDLRTAGVRRDLLSHPRFHAIFSRQGDMGSRERYPHPDLRPWVEAVVEVCSWDRVHWGSEYPVLYWRNEQIDRAARWILDLGIGVDDDEYHKFTVTNTRRAFFDETRPEAREARLPPWVEEQFDRIRPVFLFPHGTWNVPMDVYEPLLREYVRVVNRTPGGEDPMTFSEFLIEQLRVRTRELRSPGGRDSA